MLKKFLLGLILTQSFYAAAFDMHTASKESHLARVLSKLVHDVQITQHDGQLRISGPQMAVQAFLASVNDLSTLRRSFLPFDQRAINVHVVDDFSSWKAFLSAVGIQQADYDLVNLGSAADRDGSLTFATGSKTNKRVANAYKEGLLEESSFFAWAVKQMPHIVEETADSLIIHYGRLGTFLTPIPHQQANNEGVSNSAEESDNQIRHVEVPVSDVLRKIIAACSDEIVLERTEKPGEYRPSTVSLREGAQALVPGCLDIVVDNSTSMDGEKINKANQELKKFLEAISENLPNDTQFETKIYAISDNLVLHDSLQLVRGIKPDAVRKISTVGGTNLHKLTGLFTTPKHVVCLFTDCEDSNSEKTLESLSMIQEARDKGEIAQVILCEIGAAQNAKAKETYLSFVSQRIGGKTFSTTSTSEFFQEAIKSAADLTQARSPLTFVIEGRDITLWQPEALGLHPAAQTVRAGDTVNFRGVPRMVADYEALIAQHKQEIERLQALQSNRK